MPSRHWKGSTRQWRAMRRVVALHLAVSGSLPCPHCGKPISINEPWDLDHLVPKSAGGTDSWTNLAPAHPHCNRRAGQRLRNQSPIPAPSRAW
ncbi:MAG: HNH endonuclease [Actinobacteria bacterium]|nr:HNH endonuclease [Actinomycetota bacterium]